MGTLFLIDERSTHTEPIEKRRKPHHANLRENAHGQDHHPRGRAIRHHRECQVQDPGQGRYSSRSAAIDLRWQAARGRPNLVRLQHPEGEHPPLGPPTSRRCHRAISQDLGPEIQLQQVDLPKVLRSIEPTSHQLPKAKVRSIQRSSTKEASQLNKFTHVFSIFTVFYILPWFVFK